MEHQEHEEDHTHYHGVDKAGEHLSYDVALSKLLVEIVPVGSEVVPLEEVTDRILYKDLISQVNLPRLARSTRDGYAVSVSGEVAEGTRFKLVGEARIGVLPKITISRNEAVKIATGSFLPRGGNAVLMKEYARLEDMDVLADKRIGINDNILGVGEDIPKGRVLLRRGTRVRPHHISLLSMLGTKKISVFRRPKIAFFSTGDELADSSSSAKTNEIYDGTRPFIKSMLIEMGTKPVDLGIAKDSLKQIKRNMLRGIKYDGLILSAGSSVGERDFVSNAASINGVRILVHGVAMRPSSPTGLAVFKGRPFILLPGFPTSAIVSFLAFARPAISKLSGNSCIDYPMIRAKLVEGYEGNDKLTYFLRVEVKKENGKYVAVIAKPTDAQFSSWLHTANGIAMINEERGKIAQGEEVDVFLIGDTA